ncbi:MAG: TRAP transporter substrate-binding protein [Pseudorhodoplanes sp.]|jgi:tripartite ATP-independent transporter DctP family solute receptor|nr:TRAP transporter substrate-binding protein [Pseudorhodoplanes sp.]
MSRTLNRRAFSSLLAAGVAAPFLAPARTARAATTFTVASLFGADKPETKIWLKIREIVDARLPGRFDFRIVQNAALGGEKEVAEGIRLGSIRASLSTVSALSSWVPESQVLDAPFVFRDAGHVRRVLDGPIGTGLKAKFAAQNFMVQGFINYGARHLLAKEPLTRPSQLAGKRIRVIQSPLHTELWKAFGANPTPIPIPETYNALQTGVVDMMDLTKSAYAGFKLYEVVPYLIETGHIWATGVVYFSAPFWKSLKDDERTVFAAAAAEGALYFDQLIVEDEKVSMQKAASAGGKTVAIEDRAAWENGARGVWASLAPKVGGLDKIKAITETS